MDYSIKGVSNRYCTTENVCGGRSDEASVEIRSLSVKKNNSDSPAYSVGLLKHAMETTNTTQLAHRLSSNASGISNTVASKRVESALRAEDCLEKKRGTFFQLTLKDQVDHLCKLNQCLSEEVANELIGFADKIFEFELPLYQPEMHILIKNVKNIHVCCDKRHCATDVQTIQSCLNNIEKLYPDLLYTFEPEVYLLVDCLFDHGLIKGEEINLIERKGLRNFIYHLTRPDNKITIERFIEYTEPFLENEHFLALIKDEPFLFICDKNMDFFAYWQSIVERKYPNQIDHLKNGVFIDISKWNKYPRALIVKNKDAFEEAARVALNQVCKKIRLQNIIADRDRFYEALSGLGRLLNNKANPLSHFFECYFTSLTQLQKKCLSNLACLGYPLLFKYMLNAPFSETVIQCIIGWRDSAGKTAFHFFGRSGPNLLLKRRPEIIEQILDFPNGQSLLLVRDHTGKTALESYFYYNNDDPNLPENMETIPLNMILQRSLVKSIQPAHIIELLNRVSPHSGFHAWLLCQLVTVNGLVEELVTVFSAQGFINSIVGDFQNNFRELLVRYAPLHSPGQQEGFLRELKTLAFKSTELFTIVQAFPVHMRALAVPNPFSFKNQGVWKSEVIPFCEYLGFGVGSEVDLPWSPLLKQAWLCFTPPENIARLQEWQECLSAMPQPEQWKQFTDRLPSGDSGTFGRSCYFHDPGKATTLRLKFRKQKDGVVEPWDELASEPFKLECLKKWQGEKTLSLQTRFPEPVGLYRVSDFRQWLEQSPLTLAAREDLLQCVHIEEDGSVLTYAYQTGIHEYYHCYPYDTEGDGLSVELSLDSLQVAANDLGLLVNIGLAATVLPMYHADKRHFVLLTQLINVKSPGVLGSYNHNASNYPNVSPGVGLRDYADILPLKTVPVTLNRLQEETPENRQIMNMEQISREFFSLIILLPRVFEKEMDFARPEFLAKLSDVITGMTCSFFGNAFGLEKKRIADSLKKYGVAEELARVISFWCEMGDCPKWVKHFRAGTLPEAVYPKACKANTRYDNTHADTLTDRGFFKTTRSKGLNLGPPNGIFPLLPLNKLLTQVFNLCIHTPSA